MPTAQVPTDMAGAVRALLARFDPTALPAPRRLALVRLATPAGDALDVVLKPGRRPHAVAPGAGRPAATITADAASWAAVAADGRRALDAFGRGRLRIRGDLHLGIGLLAATSGASGRGRLRFGSVGPLASLTAGEGPPVILLHGLGSSKVSMLPTAVALSGAHRAIALDLPGFGDSHKPLRAPYHAPFFARAVVRAMDDLGIERADVVGNSMGGRVALELAFRFPERTRRLALLAPSLAWLRKRPWALPLQLVRPELGLLQPAPRAVVERIVRNAVPGGGDGFAAAGIDDFLRSYLTARGRAAFYAAARSIYLEDPARFWRRLEAVEHDALFVWGRRDTLVPIGFARHVERALPAARHLELDCGHVPQLERPRATHRAVLDFLADG